MSKLQTVLWHTIWAVLVALVVLYGLAMDPGPWQNALFVTILAIWFFMTTLVWDQPWKSKDQPDLRSADELFPAERVDIATTAWDVLGTTNRGRAHRRHLFRGYLDDLGELTDEERAVERSKRRKAKKRRKNR